MGLNSDCYTVIQGWMCNELNLKGNDLLIFALIYGFSQDGESKFCGGRKYIADTFNISLPTVDKSLKSLVDKNLIEQISILQNNVTFHHYKTLPVVKKLYRPSKETLPNNNINNKNNIFISKDINNTTGTELKQFEFGKPKIKKESLYSQCIGLINDFTSDEKLRTLLVDWLDMLLEKYRDRGKPLYKNIFKGKLNMLVKFDENDWLDIVEYNLQKGYEGFYPIPLVFQKTASTLQNIEDLKSSEVMTQTDYEELKKVTEKRRKNGLRTSF